MKVNELRINNLIYYNISALLNESKEKYKIIETVNNLKNNSKFTIPNSDKPIIIQYVHQLQNLLYSLTGEELTIKQD